MHKSYRRYRQLPLQDIHGIYDRWNFFDVCTAGSSHNHAGNTPFVSDIWILIDFKTLHMDGFVIAFPKDHPVIKEAKKKKLTEISQDMLWEYPQVVQIPPYLLKNVFSKGSHILPVNEKLDNILCSFASEVYGLVKAGFGFAFVPEYLAIPDKELVFYPFKETHHAPFGIYFRKESLEAKDSAVSQFLDTAERIYSTTTSSPERT